MTLPTTLNLLIIDDNQLYAEQLVSILEQQYYKKVTLGFLDAKDELIKLLRQSWDVLVMGEAYDLTLPQVITILKAHKLDIPVISIISDVANPDAPPLDSNERAKLALVEDDDKTDRQLPLHIYWGAVNALPKNRVMEMAISIFREHQHLINRKTLNNLRHVLFDAEQRANILIKNSKSAVAYIEEGLHIYANDPYLQMFGYHSMEALMGMPVVDLIASNNIKDFKQFLKDFEKGNRNNVEFRFESIKSDGSTFAAKLQLAAATYEGQPCLQVIIQQNDQGHHAELAKKIAQIERIDALTGVLNRRGFEEVLEKVRDITVAKQLSSGLLYLRLDNIGRINSTLGIQGVDTLLIAVTQFLKTQVNQLLGDNQAEKGYLSRFSDASFMVILPNTAQDKLTEWAQQLIATIADTLFEIGDRTAKTTLSVGATMLTQNSPDATALIDRVMQAGETVRNTTNNEGNAFYLYDPSNFANSDDAALLEALRTALEQNKFQLMYQPIYDIEEDTSNLFEVFLRLPLADGKVMTPDQFLDVAQRHNLMERIDRWVLIRACKTLKEYRQTTEPTARLLIHLSTNSLTDSTLPAFIGQLIKAIGGDTQHTLTVQFNEASLPDYLTVAAKQSEQLKALQCDVGIYNFGSVVNSDEILNLLKPNLVRLDGSYIKEVSNSDNLATIKSLITRANKAGSDALMGFIEDAPTMSAAWTVGARYLQGYYLQEPTDTMIIQAE